MHGDHALSHSGVADHKYRHLHLHLILTLNLILDLDLDFDLLIDTGLDVDFCFDRLDVDLCLVLDRLDGDLQRIVGYNECSVTVSQRHAVDPLPRRG